MISLFHAFLISKVEVLSQTVFKKEKNLTSKREISLRKRKIFMLVQSLQKKWHFFVREFRNEAQKRRFPHKTAILAEKSIDFFARIAAECFMPLFASVF